MLHNLFCTRYNMSSKYGLTEYTTCISFTVTSKSVPVLFSIFYLYQPTFALICLHLLGFAIQEVPANEVFHLPSCKTRCLLVSIALSLAESFLFRKWCNFSITMPLLNLLTQLQCMIHDTLIAFEA